LSYFDNDYVRPSAFAATLTGRQSCVSVRADGHPMTATAYGPTTQADRSPVLVDFALQGGGAHGAFTWGVLDRLLEEPWLEIDGISGTSAGAMNAAVLVDGYAESGAAGARQHLERYWRRVSEAARFSPFRRTPLDMMMGRWTSTTRRSS
jgi:predicted acylesterase/phospholipase RssA